MPANTFWWLVIIAAAMAMLWYAFRREPGNARRRVGAGGAEPGIAPEITRGEGLSTDARFMTDAHEPDDRAPTRNDNAGAPIRPANEGTGPKVGSAPDLWPDRTGARTAMALGATELPADEQRRLASAPAGGPGGEPPTEAAPLTATADRATGGLTAAELATGEPVPADPAPDAPDPQEPSRH